jgi:hypothetical protein
VTNDAQPTAHQNGDQPAEIDAKIEMIMTSYAEVLDATKHQDDKIGQLLTSISFLTAATLALAALESGDFITRSFAVAPFKLPLALITLAVFLVGVAWTVMMLLGSLSTPLRLPGLVRPRKKDPDPIKWVRGIKASQIYFFEMANISVDQWETKWKAPVNELKAERLESLVRETHNLGVRTHAKYDRTTEAVGLLSISLLAFALSIIFVAIVAANPDPSTPIVLSLWQRVLVGSVFGCYVWIQTLGRIRYNRQAVDETPPSGTSSPDRRKFIGELWYALLIGLLIVDMLEYDGSWPGLRAWIVITIVLMLGCIIAYWFSVSQISLDDDNGALAPTITWQERMRHPLVSFCETWDVLTLRASWKLWVKAYGRRFTSVVLAFTAITIWLGVIGWYAWQLGLTSLVVFLLIGSGILQPTVIARNTREKFWKEIRASQKS